MDLIRNTIKIGKIKCPSFTLRSGSRRGGVEARDPVLDGTPETRNDRRRVGGQEESPRVVGRST